jgi:tRNA U34 5-methylaminomethyl-2-thiouridine-forming methyltransferase MnmC
MQTRIEQTLDGSHTLFVPSLNEHYHSTFGAIRESEFIFIDSGLKKISESVSPARIFEMGFGTGLNAFLSVIFSAKTNRKIIYTTIESFPLSLEMIEDLNYPEILDPALTATFRSLHSCEWNMKTKISEYFTLEKFNDDIRKFNYASGKFDLVYWDAFGPDKQPELWTEDIFRSLADAVVPNGILVTYSCKGSVRRALANAGFHVEKIPGPVGKREITRAFRK